MVALNELSYRTQFCDKPPIELLCLLVVYTLYMTRVHYKQENLLPSNHFIEDCEYVPTEPFTADHVEQVKESADKLFTDICGVINLNPVSERQLIQKRKLNIRAATKDKLIQWLENACYLLDTCSIPLLE